LVEDDEMNGTCSTYRRYEKCIQNLGGKRWRKEYLGDFDVDGRTILKWILRKYYLMVWTWFNWLRKGTSGGFFRTR